MNNFSFLSTKKLVGPYKFLIRSCKIHFEDQFKTNTKFVFFDYKKKNFRAILFLIKTIFNTFFFSRNLMSIKYKKIDISRYTVPEIYKNHKIYFSKFEFFKEATKCFYKNFNLVMNAFEVKDEKIKGAFIDHCMYQNGIILSIFSNFGIPIYTLGYPKGIIYFKNKKKRNMNYEDIIQLRKSLKVSLKEKKTAKTTIEKILNKTEEIPWMRRINFVKKIHNYNEHTHLIYTHSFTDAQLVYGYDEFTNVYDWLYFTLQQLSKNKKNKILVKAHPAFFHTKFPTSFMMFDQKLFNGIINDFSDKKNIKFIKEPIKNFELMKQISKRTIIISHHGSAILEALFCGFKCISSKATFWKSNLKLSNSWKNKKEYISLLNLNWDKLKKPNKIDLLDVINQLFCNPLSLYGSNYWQQIISEELSMDRQEIYEKSKIIFDKMKINDKKIYKISKKISKTIEFVKV